MDEEERNEATNLIMTLSKNLLSVAQYAYWNRKAVYKGIKKLCKKLSGFKVEIKLDFEYKLLKEDSDFMSLTNFEDIDKVSAVLADILEKYDPSKEPEVKRTTITNYNAEQSDNSSRRDSNVQERGERFSSVKDVQIPPEVFKKRVSEILKGIDELIQKSGDYDEGVFFSDSAMQKLVCSFNYLDESSANLRKLTVVKKKQESKVSTENSNNIYIAMLHHFTYRFLYSITQPITSEYITSFGGDANQAGTVLALGPVAALVSTFLFAFSTNKNYYLSLFSCSMIFIVAFICFILAGYYEQVMLVGISRLLVGLGSSRIISKRYLSDYAPKSKIAEYSFGYVVVGAIGLAMGPTITLLCEYIPEFYIGPIKFDRFTNPGLVSLVFSIFFLILCLVKFTDPYGATFSIFEEELMPEPASTSKTFEMDRIDKRLEKIEEKQHGSTFSYIRAASILLFTFLVVSNVIVESLLVSSPTYLGEQGKKTKFISLLQAICLFLVFPISLLFQKATSKMIERRLLVYLFLIALIGSILITGIVYDDMYHYIFWFFMLLNVGNLIESVSSSIFAKILPKTVSQGLFNSGFLIILFTTVGKTVGAVMNAMATKIDKTNINKILYFSVAGLIVYSFIIGLIFYGDLRIKAIARLMKKDNSKQIN